MHFSLIFRLVFELFGIVRPYCTVTTCPEMTGSPAISYFWSEGNIIEKLPACDYIHVLIFSFLVI